MNYQSLIQDRFPNIKILSIKYYRTPVVFNCTIHGEQYRRLDHLIKTGCKHCKVSEVRTISKNEFIKNAKLLHGTKYDYSNINYINSKTSIEIYCQRHGYFNQLPNNHLNGSGCKYCNYILHRDDVYFKLNKIYQNITFNIPNDLTYNTIIVCKCAIHGEFNKSLKLLYMGHSCKSCSSISIGEEKIVDFFLENDIKFEREKTFDNCVFKYKLRFDFYLPHYNYLIEYNGIQHYEPVEYFGGVDTYNAIVERDKYKSIWCVENSIPLLIIKYDDVDYINKLLKIPNSYES